MPAPQPVMDALDKLDAANAAAQQARHDLDGANAAVADAQQHQQQAQAQQQTDEAAVAQARADLERALDDWLAAAPPPPPPPPAPATARAPVANQAGPVQRPGIHGRPPAPRR